MKKLYLITGAAGHLGSTIIRRLSTENCLIRGLLLPGENALFPGRVEYFHGDVTKPESLEPFLSGIEGFESQLIHAAGIISIGDDEYQKLYETNVRGTENIIESCISHHVGRLLYVSSVHAIPEIEGHVISEVSSFRDDDVDGNYAKTKAIATEAVVEAARMGLVDAVVVQPSGIIGPYDSGSNHMVQMVRMHLSGKLPAGIEGGYDFVDVRDVALGCLEALEKGRTGECYILSNRYVAIKELIGSISMMTGGKDRICIPIWMAKCFSPLFRLIAKITRTRPLYTSYALKTLSGNGHFSHMKATLELGYRPRPMEATIADTIAWLRAEA